VGDRQAAQRTGRYQHTKALRTQANWNPRVSRPSLPADDIVLRDEPITCPARTLLDLATELSKMALERRNEPTSAIHRPRNPAGRAHRYTASRA
jgi:hypothetical protein